MRLTASQRHLLVMRNRGDQHLVAKQWPTRRIVLLVLPGTNLMTLAGQVDVFTRASRALLRPAKRTAPFLQHGVLHVVPLFPLPAKGGESKYQPQACLKALSRYERGLPYGLLLIYFQRRL